MPYLRKRRSSAFLQNNIQEYKYNKYNDQGQQNKKAEVFVSKVKYLVGFSVPIEFVEK